MGEVRKLQKKLRQIGSLEIKISLSPEERFKISRKAELRSRLAELQLQLSGPQQTLGIVADEKQEKMKRHVEDAPEALPSQTPPAPKILKAEKKSKTQETPAPAARQREAGGGAERDRQQERTAPAKIRDTTVKVWHVPTAAEEHKNLGGHTGGPGSVSVRQREVYFEWLCRLQREDLGLSVGQCVKSLYTFNAVTALCFVPEGDGYIVTGSDAGKVQAWSWHTFQNCQSINAHQEAVTSIQAQGPLVFCGSADGGVSVWENRCSDRDPLRLLHHWGGEVTGCGGGAGGVSPQPRGDRVFLSYGRAWLKILHWRTGSGDHRWVTGGRDLLVWEQLPSAGKQRGDVTAKRDSRLESCVLESEGDSEDDEDTDDFEDDDDNEGEERRCDGVEDGGSSSWLRSISPVARLTALLLVALVTQPSTCNRDDSEEEQQLDALSVQLSVTAQVTPTPLWAVVWGPTQPLEDETYHFLSSQETEALHGGLGGDSRRRAPPPRRTGPRASSPERTPS
ncbi:hypothetical protein F7725_017984 [Dissostichus mawsoni]|uniref:Uncharacterized protein n=1 Tax=Dissostichus mawsoni TaxID=36200 RepID=A0A7J5XRT5_DISMA|nr:hypothetical protein F7725_017984 [Dissostichus mawsoni]